MSATRDGPSARLMPAARIRRALIAASVAIVTMVMGSHAKVKDGTCHVSGTILNLTVSNKKKLFNKVKTKY